MANLLGLSGMYIGYLKGEFALFWDTSHNIFCSTLTVVWAILLLVFPIWSYFKMIALARYRETNVIQSDKGNVHIYNNVFCEGISTYCTTTYLYNFYFVIQRFITAIVLIILKESPLFQISVFVLT